MEWKISPEPVPYEEAVKAMEERVEQILAGKAPELVWLLEHPPTYTAGTSANDSDLIDSLGFPVFKTGRGGQYTYHGPGQRVAYVMLDLKKRTPDVRFFVKQLEKWIIATLATWDIQGKIREGRVGVWVNIPAHARVRGGVLHDDPAGEIARSAIGGGAPPKISEAKIAALGVRLRKWVTFHGIAINVNPNLDHYRGIIPCGISEYGVTSLAALGVKATTEELDQQLMEKFEAVFGKART